MNHRQRITKLEEEVTRNGDLPEAPKRDFNFRVSGMSRREAQQKYIDKLREAIADPTATPAERERWQATIVIIERAMEPSAPVPIVAQRPVGLSNRN